MLFGVVKCGNFGGFWVGFVLQIRIFPAVTGLGGGSVLGPFWGFWTTFWR